MPSGPNPREVFENFLAGVDLEGYRERYSPIKTVELNLPKQIHPLAAMYECYWAGRPASYPCYEEFYDAWYLPSVAQEAEEFRVRSRFSKETFYLGLRARIYRTWASVLTQIQGAYVAEEIYGVGNVHMSVSQDHRGRDIIFTIPDIGDFGVQIKKSSERKDALTRRTSDGGGLIDIDYEVPSAPPLTPVRQQRSKGYQRWEKKWGRLLRRLDNGFIVFRDEMFVPKRLLRAL